VFEAPATAVAGTDFELRPYFFAVNAEESAEAAAVGSSSSRAARLVLSRSVDDEVDAGMGSLRAKGAAAAGAGFTCSVTADTARGGEGSLFRRAKDGSGLACDTALYNSRNVWVMLVMLVFRCTSLG